MLIQNDQPDGKLSSSSIVVSTQDKNVHFFLTKRLNLYCVLICYIIINERLILIYNIKKENLENILTGTNMRIF